MPNWTKEQHDDWCAKNRGKRLRSVQPEPVERMPLEPAGKGEEACWHDAARSFEIQYVIYSTRPCDYDGYDIKFLQDFCVAAGIIPSDKWNVLSGRVMSRKAATKAEERTEITVLSFP